MITKISKEGQMVIPKAIREQARIKGGDQIDVGFSGGLIVMRKRQPLTLTRVQALLLARRGLPEITVKDEAAVSAAAQRVRHRVSA